MDGGADVPPERKEASRSRGHVTGRRNRIRSVSVDTLRPPVIASSLEPAGVLELTDEVEWHDVEVSGDLSGLSADDVDLSGCLVTAAACVGTGLRSARIQDTRFVNSDLSAVSLANAELRRVEFLDCRMSAADLGGAKLEDVRFVQCKLDDANLRMVTGNRVRFEECVMTAADLYAARLPGAHFTRCDLTSAALADARLEEARFGGSNIEGVRGTADLRGAVFDHGHLVALGLWFSAGAGIVFDDDAYPAD